MFKINILYLTGAYGREATESDWRIGKDFKIVSGPYCSIRDCEAMKADNGGGISIYYNYWGAKFLGTLRALMITQKICPCQM